MAGTLLIPMDDGIPIVPSAPPPDMAVAANYEVFDGLEPLDHPAARDSDKLNFIPVGGPRPGASNSQRTGDVYTPGPLAGVRGVIGGMPLPVAYPLTGRQMGGYTKVGSRTIQFRIGSGGRGPSALGAAQTVQLSEITNNPPQAGELSSIIAGQA